MNRQKLKLAIETEFCGLPKNLVNQQSMEYFSLTADLLTTHPHLLKPINLQESAEENCEFFNQNQSTVQPQILLNPIKSKENLMTMQEVTESKARNQSVEHLEVEELVAELNCSTQQVPLQQHQSKKLIVHQIQQEESLLLMEEIISQAPQTSVKFRPLMNNKTSDELLHNKEVSRKISTNRRNGLFFFLL